MASPDEAAASSLTSAGALGDLHQTFMRPPSQHGLWRVEYNFTSLYDVPDITPTSMEDISMRLKNNKTWFDAYFRYMMHTHSALKLEKVHLQKYKNTLFAFSKMAKNVFLHF